MRQGQQNRRGRGRHQQGGHNNNRKHQNPLSRSFESNGPDVKIRGTPAHIAEKYMSLARDAQMSGDPVLAENYLQHAEHYNRIIMAYREQMPQQGDGQQQGGQPRMRPEGEAGEMGEDEAAEMADETGLGQGGQPQVGGQRFDQDGREQPRHERRPDHRQGEHRQQRFDRGFDRERQNGGDRGEGGYDRFEGGGRRDDRGFRDNRDRDNRDFNRFRGRDNRDRPDRQDQPRFDRDRGGDRSERSSELREQQPPRPERVPEAAGGGGEPAVQPQQRRRERYQPPSGSEQPEFLRRPVRRPRSEDTPEAAPAGGDEPPSE